MFVGVVALCYRHYTGCHNSHKQRQSPLIRMYANNLNTIYKVFRFCASLIKRRQELYHKKNIYLLKLITGNLFTIY